MSERLLDLKLKRLIQLCKETGNYKKLAVVSFVLVSNMVDEIGIKPYNAQEFLHPLSFLIATGNPVHFQRFADDGPDRHARVQRGVGVLKDHLHPATHVAQVGAFETR